MALRHLRLVAVNIDGVMLNDTFSPVIHRFVVNNGGVYTAELERAVFSQPRLKAAAALGLPGSPEEVAEAYFIERERYLRDHPVHVLDGADRLLGRLSRLDVPLICYGGLERPHFDLHLSRYAHYFTQPRYVCTDSFRPGVREISRDLFGLRSDQVLFIDDVARVAETARTLGTPFIGHPSSYGHSFQEQLMHEVGVRHLVRSLDEIDESLLHILDSEAAEGSVWQDTRVAAQV
ncbi:HAD family hydrolase [Streptomyces sp. NPDC090106]|uniref:HAD family hydrolase n=1 Tax=Streptomyces sp. NPDC090106 TaxID=3365946 RepID=UPI00382C13D6